MIGGRKPSAWNMFVKKIYHEGHKKNSKYSFRQALSDASDRKGEMGSMGTKKTKKMNKRYRKASIAMTGGKSRRNK